MVCVLWIFDSTLCFLDWVASEKKQFLTLQHIWIYTPERGAKGFGTEDIIIYIYNIVINL